MVDTEIEVIDTLSSEFGVRDLTLISGKATFLVILNEEGKVFFQELLSINDGSTIECSDCLPGFEERSALAIFYSVSQNSIFISSRGGQCFAIEVKVKYPFMLFNLSKAMISGK